MIWLIVTCCVIVAVGFVAFTGAPYVPSKAKDVRRAFTELYPLSEVDTLVDIGSGDGIVLREASARGAKAVGYEIHPLLVLISRILSTNDQNVKINQSNFWHAPLPQETTVVYTFGDGRDIVKMARYVQNEVNRINHTISFISYAFTTDQTPDKTVGAHHLYIMRPLQDVDAPL